MTTYWKGACHDCRQWIWLSNVDADYAERCLHNWAETKGHVGHDIQFGSEYDDILDLRISGETPIEYLGFGSWKTERNGPHYTLMNAEDGFCYQWQEGGGDENA